MTIELQVFILVAYLALYLSKKLKITKALMGPQMQLWIMWPFETTNEIFLVTNVTAPWFSPSPLTILWNKNLL